MKISVNTNLTATFLLEHYLTSPKSDRMWLSNEDKHFYQQQTKSKDKLDTLLRNLRT